MKNSEIFWNSIPIIAQIILGFYSIPALLLTQAVLTGVSLLWVMVGEETPPPIFLWFTPILGGFITCHGIVEGFKWLCNNPVQKFNDWLDKEKEEKEKKLKFKEFLKDQNNNN